VTLHLHDDDDLARARAAAAKALRDRLKGAGYTNGPIGQFADVLAEVAVEAADAELERVHHERRRDGR
jgi:hypothetical protein